ncbi:hypothetical protein EUGRSUZ_C01683 [Eucalyptus grandis]|uniref:Uncharacterized protein n=2 Tax=Eucalyptus grandis TaxID=71139 RepID=A0A059CQ07_EUCGR|nr:hypothetical protein EUGRSUZ_C01683 [Eucalyptus grandis]
MSTINRSNVNLEKKERSCNPYCITFDFLSCWLCDMTYGMFYHMTHIQSMSFEFNDLLFACFYLLLDSTIPSKECVICLLYLKHIIR